MIWNYVKSRAGTIVVFLLLYLTAGVVAALYGLSAVAVGYAGILCAVLFLGAGVWDFFSFVRKIHQLEAAKKEILITEEHLPHPDSLAEKQYQEMLGLLQEEKKRIEQEKEQQFQEMMEYYTMWAHQIKTPIAA